jgi:hypothetical protein
MKAKSSRSHKVKEEDFSPNTRRLAITTKNHLRFKVATGEGDAFPPADANGRNDFIIKTIKEAANKYGDSLEPKLTSVLSRVMKDVDVFDDLITFVRVSL